MATKRIGRWLLICGLLQLLLVASSWAQDPVPVNPLPIGITEKLQPFAFAEATPYSGYPRPNRGWYFAFDQLQWWETAPRSESIGNPNLELQEVVGLNGPRIGHNGLTTGQYRNDGATGQRYEFGYAGRKWGLLCSIIDVRTVMRNISAHQVEVLFSDPGLTLSDYGGVSIRYDFLQAQLRTKITGVELSPTYRLDQFHFGGNMEVLGGLRYLRYDERFDVYGWGGIGDQTQIMTRGINDLFGPQMGLRYWCKNGRWTAAFEGRFFAAANFNNGFQNGAVGDHRLVLFRSAEPVVFSNIMHNTIFSPTGEMRFNFVYQVTRNLSFRAGWTGMYITNLLRPSRAVNYSLPEMGIRADHLRDNCFVQGLNLGVEFNR